MDYMQLHDAYRQQRLAEANKERLRQENQRKSEPERRRRFRFIRP